MLERSRVFTLTKEHREFRICASDMLGIGKVAIVEAILFGELLDMEFIKSAIKKRSIFLRGQKTSISLEDAFWNAMKTIAQRRNISLGALIEGIDAVRNEHNLSSAIRVFVLEEQLEANRERTKH